MLITISIVLLGLTVLCIYIAGGDGGHSKAASAAAAGDMPKLHGDGRYGVEVVSDPSCRQNLRALYPVRDTGDGETRRGVVAELRLENDASHDDGAVAVHIQEHRIGYLARPAARHLRQAIRRDGQGHRDRFLVDALVRPAADPAMGHSVMLDLPQA